MFQILKTRQHKLLASLLICVFVLSLASIALAGTLPLNYVATYVDGTSTLVDNNSSVPNTATLQIKFDKNVTNDTVLQNNIQCITLKDSLGNTVPATVFRKGTGLPGDVERQNLYLTPSSNLTAGPYTIVISPNLTAYNGITLGNQVDVSFGVQ